MGCAKNLVDSEVMLGYLERAGYLFQADPEQADIIIINTCGFIQPARLEAEEQFLKAIELKRSAGPKTLVAAGCYVEREEDSLRRRFPEIDLWTGVKDTHHIVDLLSGGGYRRSDSVFLYDHRSPRRRSTPPAFAYVKISEGCSHRCGFCAIPLIKGPYRSRSVSSIIEEVTTLVTEEVQEINLISQDSTSFASDRHEREGLARLLEVLLKSTAVKWIRVLYGYPERITDRLIEVMGESRICSYFDTPFQHADPGLLHQMKRGLDGSQALRLIERVRNKIPDAAWRTSLIVGFPGEGPREFDALKRFVVNSEIDHLGVFTYSPEPGTACHHLGDPVPEKEKNRRRGEIMEIQSGISRSRNRRYVGRRMDVLIEGRLKKESGVLVGRTRYQAPEVDGLVFIDFESDEFPHAGSIQTVEITDSEVYDLFGVIKT